VRRCLAVAGGLVLRPDSLLQMKIAPGRIGAAKAVEAVTAVVNHHWCAHGLISLIAQTNKMLNSTNGYMARRPRPMSNPQERKKLKAWGRAVWTAGLPPGRWRVGNGLCL